MHTSIQLRLVLTLLLVLLIGMMTAAGLSWRTVERLFIATQCENLQAQAEMTAAAFSDSLLAGGQLPDLPSDPYSQTLNVQPGIHTRLLGENGVVVNLPLSMEAEAQVPPAENAAAVTTTELMARPEIQHALAGSPDSAVRRVRSAGGRRVLYAAAPIYDAGGQIAGIIYLATPLPPAGLPTGSLLQLAAALLGAVLLAGAAGVLLSRRIALPLETLARAAGRVAEGDLAQRVPAGSKIRELQGLGEAFNHMTERLQQSDRLKNAFIADVTHELRTPLTVINGTIETLEDGALDDLEGRGPLLASMQRETRRLIRLVNDLLVLARAEAGALNLSLTEIDLEALARERCANLHAVAETRQISLRVLVQQPASACGDADRVVQVLDNLLDNALRHAPAGSMVTVSLRPDGNEVRCTVRDQGAGIPAEHLPFIFERFYRAESARKRHSSGTGLGLSIVRSLVLAQGGRVHAESTEGEGAAISFWLPATCTDERKLPRG